MGTAQQSTTDALSDTGADMAGLGTLLGCVRDCMERGPFEARRAQELGQAISVLEHLCSVHSAALLDRVEDLRDGSRISDRVR